MCGIDGSARPQRRLTSGATALVLAVVAVFVWWFASGNSPFAPRGNGETLPQPQGGVTPPADASGGGPELVGDAAVPLESFVTLDGSRIALNFTTGDPDCVGDLDTPRILENDGSVTVTLAVVPLDPDAVCPTIAVPRTLVIDLDGPLDGRSLLDGSYAPPIRVEPTTRTNEPVD